MQLQLSDLISFAKKYRDLGDAARQHLDVIMYDDYDDVNPNVGRMIEEFLTWVQQAMDVDEPDDPASQSLSAALSSCQEVLANAESTQ